MEQRDALCTAVRRVAWGYLLILLDINLFTLNILPNWLGYVLILRALPALKAETPSAGLLDPLGVLLAFWDGICWIGKLLGYTVDWPLPQLLATAISLYFHFQLLTNLSDIAGKYSCPCAARLRTLRTVQVVLLTAAYLLSSFVQSVAVLAVLALVNLIVLIWICRVLFLFHRHLTEPPEGSPA